MLKREFKMKNGRYHMNKQNTKKLVIYGVIGLFLIITIFSSFQTIKSGEVGLKVRFGKIVNTQLNEGLNLNTLYWRYSYSKYKGTKIRNWYRKF